MGCDPLADDRSLTLLKYWMYRAGYITLWDISNWENGNWHSWINFEVPQVLSNEYATLIELLNGKAPLNNKKLDSRGWGPILGQYSVSQGYRQILEHPHVPPDPKPWQGVWSQHSIPKIDYFCWLLCHQRILTDDRLKKRGYLGPSRCALCGVNAETAAHLMLNCKFVSDLWNEALGPWSLDFVLPNSIPELFSNWKRSYPGGPPQNTHVKVAWCILPKLICWHTWLERN